ncbi:MAG: hypothetical protein ACT4ON_09945 [Bacteroidota bacterium]
MNVIKFFFIFFLLMAVDNLAQTFEPGKGKAVIYFESNTKVIVRLDTTFLKQTKTPISLKEGKYVIRAWAPTKLLFIDTIRIYENKTTILTKRLKEKEEYTVYKKKLYIYKTKRVLTRFVAFPLTLAYSGYIVWNYNENKKLMNEHLEKAKTAGANYGNSTSTENINKYREEYTIEKDNYERYRLKNNEIVKTAAIAISSALIVSAGLFYLSKKLVRPIAYTEKPLLSLNTISIKSDLNSTYSLGMVLNINRKNKH